MLQLEKFTTVKVWGIFVLIFAGGCTTHISPPRVTTRPTNIYIADYGRHASLILPTTNQTVTEYTYGDWDFFALGHSDLFTGLKAILFSTGSCMGKRTEPDPADAEKIAHTFGARKLQSLQVDRGSVEHLVDALDDRYRLHLASEYHNVGYKSTFVKYDEHYWLFNNSNMMTARWLREMDCKVCGPAVSSKFVVDDECPEAGNFFFRPVAGH